MIRYHFCIIHLCLLIIIGGCSSKTDYALLENKNEWSHHYAFGSPSWDNFERLPGNPIYQGRKGMEWPVNGFLFEDTVSQDWFLYIGEYTKNYSLSPCNKDINCVVYKSSDKGKTWSEMGNLFPDGMVCYDSIEPKIPDVMVTYADNKYHLIFDWQSKYSTWEDMSIGGIGYAVGDNPEGPFVVSEKPLKINTQYKNNPLLGRYWRMYAPMIFKRENDWAIAYMLDALPAWTLAVSTAQKPEGPYSDPVIVLKVERKTNYQPLQEFYPAFTHEGYVYFPSTSVAYNRNYQSIHRVKIEDMTNPGEYELFRVGSVWHSIDAENEYAGIWGQTFTGFIDDKDTFNVMYPSKNSEDFGTINLAKTSWRKPEREKGFWLTAHQEKSFTYLKKIIDIDDIRMDFSLEGEMRIVWDFNTPIDVQDAWGKFSFDDENAEYKEILLNEKYWEVNYYNKDKDIQHVASGTVNSCKDSKNTLNVRKINGQYKLLINEEKCWEGKMPGRPGLTGILLSKNSYLNVSRFEVKGRQMEGTDNVWFP